jgi:hypothetical protein
VKIIPEQKMFSCDRFIRYNVSEHTVQMVEPHADELPYEGCRVFEMEEA